MHSTSATGSAQAARLRALGLRIVAGPILRDIDTATDLGAVVAEVPESRTAAATRQLASVLRRRLRSEVA